MFKLAGACVGFNLRAAAASNAEPDHEDSFVEFE